MRYTNNAELGADIVALDYQHSAACEGWHQKIILRDIGDKCLIYTGLFPGYAQIRHVGTGYFINIGQSAYGRLSELHTQLERDLYATLSHNFTHLTDVLQSARKIHKHIDPNFHYIDSSKRYH